MRRTKHLGVLLRRKLVGFWRWPRSTVQALFRGFDRLVQGVVRGTFRFAGERLGPITIVVLVAAVIFSVCNWGWLQNGVAGPESGSTTLRNLSFVFAGLIALPLAVWRSLVSERQADAAQSQAEISQHDLLNERYQRGTAMLGSEVISIRLGGIYDLESLAKEHSKRYHVAIMQLFCAYARHARSTTEDTSFPQAPQSTKLGDDVQSILTAIASRQDVQHGFRPDLHGADLRGLNLWRGKLSRSNFRETILSNAHLFGTDLSNSNLSEADLSSAHLWSSNLSYTRLWAAKFSKTRLFDANVSGARFSINGSFPATGLTQKQLDEARAHPNDPPELKGVIDAQTQQPLEWRGKPLDDTA